MVPQRGRLMNNLIFHLRSCAAEKDVNIRKFNLVSHETPFYGNNFDFLWQRQT
jgi:hypothetical protein